MSAWVYILKCACGSYYTGCTTNLEQRIAQHKAGFFENSYTSKRLPIELLYSQEFADISQAIVCERKLKKWSHKKKEALINGNFEMLHTLSECMNNTHYKNNPPTSLGMTEKKELHPNISDFKYLCSECGTQYEITKDLMLCPKCREENLEGKPLKGILKVKLPETLRNSKNENDPFDIHDYLPVEKEYFPNLPVGNTPLIHANNFKSEFGFENVYLKFDGANPTGSYKDRASFLVSAFAKKFGLQEIVLASTGNAASSMAGIAAAAGQKAFIFMPSTAPKAKLVQCLQYGATLIPIQGDYDKAFDLSLKFSEQTGFLNRNTAYNPMTIEGKKTSSFELVSQLKNIDYVFLPAGDGVVLSGVIKGFLDLQFLGLVKKLPNIIAVQAEGSRFLFDAFHFDKWDLQYKADTVADSISVNVARNGYCAVADLKTVNGDIVLVSDDEILSAQKLLSQKTGIFCEPSSAASFAGLLKMKETISKDATVVCLLTGNGLKDIDSAIKKVNFPKTIPPDLEIISEALKLNN
ncbi:MAG: threonine synthase [Ignavibacteria bacterium]|nr:threonine synthase [Ignavibacteria bacterium]